MSGAKAILAYLVYKSVIKIYLLFCLSNYQQQIADCRR